jgi:hypothetical protein
MEQVHDAVGDLVELLPHRRDPAAGAHATTDGAIGVDPLQHDDLAAVVGQRVRLPLAVGQREGRRRLADGGGGDGLACALPAAGLLLAAGPLLAAAAASCGLLELRQLLLAEHLCEAVVQALPRFHHEAAHRLPVVKLCGGGDLDHVLADRDEGGVGLLLAELQSGGGVNHPVPPRVERAERSHGFLGLFF